MKKIKNSNLAFQKAIHELFLNHESQIRSIKIREGIKAKKLREKII